MWTKLGAIVLVLSLIASVSAAPVINPSVESRSYVCRLWFTAWICDLNRGEGGGAVSIQNNYPVSSNGTLINIYNFTSDAMNWTSDITNIFYGEGMNQTPNMTPGEKGDQGIPGINGTPGEKGDQGIPGATPDTSQFPFLDGSRAITGIWDFGGYNISNILDPVGAQDAATKAYVDAIPIYNASYWTGTNYNASYLTSTYNSTYDAKTNYNSSYANITQYAYLTLLAGSGIYPTTNPPSDFNQLETGTNKNNFIYANITNVSTQNVQWIVDMPQDWNSANTIIAQFLWTVQSGSGDLNWTLSGVRIENDVALDTVVPLITYKVDTVITANDLHVSDATAATAVTGTGNLVVFKAGRSTSSDTLGAVPAQLMGVRLKYAKLIGAA